MRSDTHQERTRQVDEPRRGVLPTSTRLIVRRSDTWWTVVLKKAAAIAETSTKKTEQRLYFEELLRVAYFVTSRDLATPNANIPSGRPCTPCQKKTTLLPHLQTAPTTVVQYRQILMPKKIAMALLFR